MSPSHIPPLPVSGECVSPFRRPGGGLHVRVATRQKLKRLMSFATVVKTAMDQQTDPDDDEDDDTS